MRKPMASRNAARARSRRERGTMKPPAFDYVAPTTVDEALTALASHEDARVLAGGQSLIPLMNLRLARSALLVDCNRIEELSTSSVSNGTARIGAFVRHRRLEL